MKNNIKDYIASILSVVIAIAVSFLSTYNALESQNSYILFLCMFCIFMIHWLIFIPSFLFKTEKYYDITGTAAYISMILVALYFIIMVNGENLSIRSIVTTLLVLIWACRLGIFLLLRVVKAGEDKRFENVKLSFSKFLMYFTISSLWVFLTTINFLTMLLHNSILINDIFFFLGLLVWIAGFIIEVVADEQKRRFKLNSNNKGAFISSGLWSYSRHPNYLGEILLWIGMAIISLPVLQGWEFITLISPLFVYILLTKMSGIPILENQSNERWGNQSDYQNYKKITPILFPFRKRL
jgi:steroid 5-alpha reductase family enzyme